MIVAITGADPVLAAVKAKILSLPLAASPMENSIVCPGIVYATTGISSSEIHFCCCACVADDLAGRLFNFPCRVYSDGEGLCGPSQVTLPLANEELL
jgi:hypothetical protein